MLEILRHIPAPVVIITAAYGDANDDDLQVRGMTCSSFTSVSLEPPFISVCLRKNSLMMQVLEKSTGFGVHLLNEENKQKAGDFAKPHDTGKGPFNEAAGKWELVSLRDYMSEVPPNHPEGQQDPDAVKGVPVLQESASLAQLILMAEAQEQQPLEMEQQEQQREEEEVGKEREVGVEVDMTAPVTAWDIERAGGLGARDDIASPLPVAMDATDLEESINAELYPELAESEEEARMGSTDPSAPAIHVGGSFDAAAAADPEEARRQLESRFVHGGQGGV
ncbi:unnamed protein product [Closterium sp. Naga37s-1]|nr:unnamed protein product [Closterium sp. Naga37s-1]